MAVPTRPYFIILNDKEHMVEAATQAAAIQHLIGDAVSELRPARAAEVAAWYRAGKPVQTVGTKPAAVAATIDGAGPGSFEPPSDADVLTSEQVAIAERGPDPQSIIDSTVKFDGGDAVHWLEQDVGFNKSARSTWDSIVTSGRMTLEQFDAMRKTCGSFSAAVAFNVYEGNMTINVDRLRVELESTPMPIADVIGFIGAAVARERAREVVMATHD